MNHFFVTPDDIRGDQVLITGSDVGHITRSLRLRAGDEITVADGQGDKYLVELVHSSDEVVEGQIKEELAQLVESEVEITLVHGLPKRKKKMDLIVEKCTELGVDRIIPALTKRTVVKLTDKKAKKRQDRWQKVALAAAKQSRRAKIPTVEEVIDSSDVSSLLADYDLALIPWEDEDTRGIKEMLQEEKPKRVIIFVGPEGGFSSEEVSKVKEAGMKPVSLGPRILRSETAGITAVALAQYEIGDLGG
ncbi:16S rRNA (uracil(1498)-N(3))-methyltransferase [Halanaerocella petrolearia]